MLLWALTQHSRGCYILLQHIVFTESNYFLLIATLLEMQYRSGEVNQNQCFGHPDFGGIFCKGPTNFQITLHCCTSQNWYRAQFSYQICILTNTLALFDKWHPRACSEVCLCWSPQGQAQFSKFLRWRFLVLIFQLPKIMNLNDTLIAYLWFCPLLDQEESFPS